MTTPWLVPLVDIRLDTRTWPRDELKRDRGAEFKALYMDGGPFALPPALLVQPPGGGFLLADGRHRYAARQAQGAPNISAILADVGGQDPIAWAFEFALADSARSSMPLTRAEKHQAVVRLVREHPDRTDVAIAGLVGVSAKTVQRARKWLTEHPDGIEEVPASREPASSPTAADVAKAMVRHLDRLWNERPLGMAMGFGDTARLGDLIGEALVDRFGLSEAPVWAERLTTWAKRANSVTAKAAREAS